jgi:signal transduction histidine kinase
MSREIPPPMNSMIDMGDLLAVDESLDEIQKKQVGILNNAGFSLLHLINQILDLTKLDAHEVLLDETEVHLQNLITEVCNFANQSNALGREQTVIDIKPMIPESITIGEAQFKKVLVALLTSAFKFSDHRNAYLTVDLASLQSNNTLLLSIKCHSIVI